MKKEPIRFHGSAFNKTRDEDCWTLKQIAEVEKVNPGAVSKWLELHRLFRFCRKRLIKGRHRWIVPFGLVELYAARRGTFPIAARRPPGYIGVKQAAERLGCSPGNVHLKAHRGELPAVRVRHRVYFDLPEAPQ